MELFIFGLVIALIIVVIDNLKKRKKITNTVVNDREEAKVELTTALPYRKKLLLTKNEWAFYKGLKPVADELGYSVLAKIKLSDFVAVNVKDKNEYLKYYNKIDRKHIDFVLAKPENLQIELLIELDDGSHDSMQKSRDEFVEAIYKQAGYKLLRVRGAGGIKEKIEELLNVESSKEITTTNDGQ